MCQHCNRPSPFRPSPRKHGLSPARKFYICTNCGEEVQGVEKKRADGSIYVKEILVRPRKPRKIISIQVSPQEWGEWKKSGLTARAFIESKAPR